MINSSSIFGCTPPPKRALHNPIQKCLHVNNIPHNSPTLLGYKEGQNAESALFWKAGYGDEFGDYDLPKMYPNGKQGRKGVHFQTEA
ncbi:hypothetical protein NQZ79_g8625 [Umbelopsis isabellina]|nr:hypothetical protein NQZ79_g8625 [Umbelopsis isabellina]